MQFKTISLWEGREDVTLTAYILDNCFDADPDRTRPAVLICPGGGYQYCSDREAEPVAMKFAAMGYHTMILRYSVRQTAPKPELVRYPKPVVDIAKALAVIRENSGAWRVDADRIGICGFSAGGHLCGELAVHWHEPWLADELGLPNERFRPNAAILVYALLDAVAEEAYMQAEQFFGAGDVNGTLLGEEHPTLEEQKKISPAYHVTPECPPCFLVHAANDFLVPVENTLNMAAALTKAQVPYEVHIFETGSHGFSVADETSSTMDFEMHPEAAGWVGLAAGWLRRHLPLTTLPGEDHIPVRGKLPIIPPIPDGTGSVQNPTHT